METRKITIFSMLVMTFKISFIMLNMFIRSVLSKTKISLLSAVSLIIENGLLSISAFTFATYTFFLNFEKFGLTSLAVVTAFHTIFSLAILGGALMIMKNYRTKIFSEIVTHQSNLSQLVKVFTVWLFGLEFLVFLAIEPKLFTMIGVAVFVVVGMLFLNYFTAGIKEGQEYNKQFEG